MTVVNIHTYVQPDRMENIEFIPAACSRLLNHTERYSKQDIHATENTSLVFNLIMRPAQQKSLTYFSKFKIA